MAQSRERRVPGAEVVDGQAHAETTELFEDVLGPVGVDHRRRLGDLDDHARRIHAVLIEPLHDAFDQVRLPELSGREVEARAHGDPAALPDAQLLGELADDPVADRRDQPELLGERDELARLDQSAVGAPPADQGLDADMRSLESSTTGW